eukprot:CAMPEP_0197704464 /NCGR_PEP_ID=MMETSP1338-20131121/125949_1 /TAXON_ID=43686 ORGANISM="Pelagodinium beii, Strain RCC1491" /NCGR_SAMPLE_ID=MMETSP1338 /ASSEMBLY_ACC=CAM_ASM_000754 /LENGTH=569 /DNA_ID=CAMNT_0043288367 /DNA_START=53 /DNA_END=1762 /DNA_ORIENTATION=-
MHRIILSAASLIAVAAGSYQTVVDTLFEEYLPEEATWVEVKQCREACKGDEPCMNECPHYECPWKRISHQCDIFNSSVAESKACHQACEHHDFACHAKCPMSQPTSVKQLQLLKLKCHRYSPSIFQKQTTMHRIILSVASLTALAAGSYQTVVDTLFEEYLPEEATWAEVKQCREACKGDEPCMNECPHYECPWKRISQQCDIFNSSVTESKACHHACEHHDFACHAKCPMSQPTSVKQLQLFGKAMLCHHTCGHDKTCHQACPNSWTEKQALCSKLEEVVSCYHEKHHDCPRLDNETKQPTSVKQLQLFGKAMLCHHTCGHDKTCHQACPNSWTEKQALCSKLEEVVSCYHEKHHDCPRLDNETKQALLEEPSSLTKDILLHVADELFRLPTGQEATSEEVHECHKICQAKGKDVQECHKMCPKGAWGRLEDQCKMMNASAICHQSCQELETKCPFKKMKCHFQCPMAMPGSVHELKDLADHVACHADCSNDQSCHGSCPDVWAQKQAQCQAYNSMMSCWSDCARRGHSPACYQQCPSCESAAVTDLVAEVERAPHNVMKDALQILMV